MVDVNLILFLLINIRTLYYKVYIFYVRSNLSITLKLGLDESDRKIKKSDDYSDAKKLMFFGKELSLTFQPVGKLLTLKLEVNS